MRPRRPPPWGSGARAPGLTPRASAKPAESQRAAEPAPASRAQLARRIRGGHGKSELGPAAGSALHGDRPPVRLDQALHDVEAQPRAATALGPPELAED